MRYDPQRYHRRSIRLRGYDYTQAGAYFVTICAQNRDCLFGDIVDDDMQLNDAGRMIQTVWAELPVHYPGVGIDTFVVMPNHIHGIIVLTVGATPRGCPVLHDDPGHRGQARGPAPTDVAVSTGRLALPDVAQRFKSLTTARYGQGVRQDGWLPYLDRLWQRNYYEHIIRNEDELRRSREYIVQNPAKWALDEENPNRE